MSVNINQLTTQIRDSGTMSPNKYVVNIEPPVPTLSTVRYTDKLSPRIQRVNLPDRSLSTIQQRSAYRESLNIPSGYSNFTDISMSILLSSDMREKKLLMAWHDLIVSAEENFHQTYLDDIVGKITILTIGDNSTLGDIFDTNIVEQHTFYGCYPLTVGDVDLTYTANDEAATIDTTFTYRYFNMVSGNVGEEVAGTKTLGDIKFRPTDSSSNTDGILQVLEQNTEKFTENFTSYVESAKGRIDGVRNDLKGKVGF